MAIELSVRTMVIVAISMLLMIFGFILVSNLSSIANIGVPDPNPTENFFTVKVTPEKSQENTKVLISASSFLELEKQNKILQSSSCPLVY